MADLIGKIALVTGGGGEIGSAVCRLLSSNGARTIVADISREVAEKTLKSLSGDNLAVEVDVTKAESVERILSEVREWCGRVPDILIHCAGIRIGTKGLLDTTEDIWDGIMEVNLKGTFLVCQKVVGAMVEEGVKGSVVNFASLGADGWPSSPSYSASKAGVVGLTKAMAKEFASHGIRVNAVSPGLIGSLMGSVVSKTNYGSRIPLGRLGEPEEVAQLCLFLASSNSSYITGSHHYITGGWYI